MEVSTLDAVAGGPSSSLPDDIIFDVLSRLPARLLCRFRCVCKRWRALLSDPAFVAAQSSRAGPLVAAVFAAASPSRACDYELRVMALYGGGGGGEALRSFRVPCMQLANTRLDLICVDHEWDGVTVVDPASGRMLAAGAEPRLAVVSVATEVSDISFGRAAASGDYKLVRIRQSVPPWPDGGARHREKLCEVATVRMAVGGGGGGAPPPSVTWRRRPAPPFLTTFESRRKASVNGVLYFLHREELAGRELVDLGDQRSVPSRDLVAVFDLESETWKKAIVRPPREEAEVEHVRLVRDNVTLGELKGALIMVHRKLRSSHGSSDWCCYATVWLLADHEKSVWVKQYAIEMPMNWGLCRALDVLGDGRVLLLNSLREEEKMGRGYSHRYVLQFYDPSTGVFADLMEMPEGFRSSMAVYTGSLLSSA